MLHPAVFVLLLLPWLNPFAPGPSPSVVPLLFSWACGFAFLGVWACRSRLDGTGRLATLVALAWLVAGVVSSGIGVLQYFNLEVALAPWLDVTAPGEAFGNLRQRNQFATLTTMALTALCWWAVHPPAWFGTAASSRPVRGRQVFGGRMPIFYVITCVLAALLALGNATSSSRTGLLQLLLLAALVGWWGGWRQPAVRRVMVVAVLTYAVAVWALPWAAGLDMGSHSLFARLRDGAPACSSRRLLWANVLELIWQKPLLGWGWGELDFAHYMHLYPGARFCEILDNAHNLPLHLAVELGIPVAVLACGAVLWWLWRQRPWQERDASRQLAWAVLAVIGLHSLLEYPLWYGPFQIAVVLCVVMLLKPSLSPQQLNDEKIQSNTRPASVIIVLIATLLIAVISYAAWDYRRVSQVYLEVSERDPSMRDDTLAKISTTRLFRSQFLFAQLGLTPLTQQNAQWTYDTATALLHYSPEPRVIEKVIESATLLGLDAEAVAHLARYRAAFPKEHAAWAAARKLGV